MAKLIGVDLSALPSPGTGSTDTAFSVKTADRSGSLFRISGDGVATISGSFTVTGSALISDNVGIGKTTPNAKLDVNGNAIVTGSLTVTNGSSVVNLANGSILGKVGTTNYIIVTGSSSTGGVIQIAHTNGGIVGQLSGNAGGGTSGLDLGFYNVLNLQTLHSSILIKTNAAPTWRLYSGMNFTFQGYSGYGDPNGGEVIMKDLLTGAEAFHAYLGASQRIIMSSSSLAINQTTPGAKLDIRTAGNLSTDLGLRVRNNANTADLFSVAGNGTTTVSSLVATSGVSIQQPAGQYYPTLSFYNNGGSLQGSIFGYSGRLTVPSPMGWGTGIGNMFVQGDSAGSGDVLPGSIMYGTGNLSIFPNNGATSGSLRLITKQGSTYYSVFEYNTSGSLLILLDKNNIGNIGIGKSTANSKLDVNGNTIITGSLNVTQGITGSLLGTSSYATQALSASFASTTNLMVGSTPITSGTNGRILFQNGGVLQQTGSLSFGTGLKVLSNGANDSFVINDSTDTNNLFKVTKEGYFYSNYYWQFNRLNGSTLELYSLNTGFSFREGGAPFALLGLNESTFGNTNTNNSVLSIRTSASYGGEYPLGSVIQGLGTNGSVILSPLSTTSSKAMLGYYNGTSYASALEYNNTSTGGTVVKLLQNGSGAVSIGQSTNGARLDVRAQGALSTDLALRVRNSANNSDIISVAGNGKVLINGFITLYDQMGINYHANSGFGTTFYVNKSNYGVGDTIRYSSTGGWNPNATGVSNYAGFSLTDIIGQSGTSTGISRGLYINPTITSAFDWRSIEWSNNTGFGLYGSGDAVNYLKSGLGIGKTSPNAKLDVSGSAIVSGSLNVTQGITGSLQGTASFANTSSYVTGSIFTNGNRALSSSFALTSSYVNTLNQAVTINGPLTVASTSSGAQSYNVLFSKNIAGATGAYNSTTTNTLAVTATTSSGFQSAALKNSLSINANSSYNHTSGHEWSAMTNELTMGSYGSVPYAADAIANTVINTTNGYTRTIGTLYDMKFNYLNYGTVSTHYGIYHGASDARHYFAGNIGIGTTSPSAKLHIVAPGALSTDLGLRVRNSANTGDLLLVTGNGGTQVGVGGLSIPRADTPGGTNNAIISHQTNGLVRIDKSLEVSGVYGRSGFDTSQVALDLGYYSSTIRNYGSATNTGFTFNTIVATTGTYFMRMQNGATDVFNISSTGNVGIGKTTASTRLDVSGSVSISGSLGIGGNTRISSPFNTAASGSALSVYGSGSAQPVFTVQGSQGELFSVTDSLSGSLFSVNDISGLPIMEVFSDNTTLMGSYQDPMLITTTKLVTTSSGAFTLYSLPTASYDTAFFEYSIRSGSNARAGSIMAMQLGSTVNFTETTTTDFGSTSGFGLTVQVAGANMILTGSATTAGWTIKTIVRGI